MDGLRPIESGQSAKESCIFADNSCKITVTTSLNLPSWFVGASSSFHLGGVLGWPIVGRLGRDKRRTDPSAGESVVWRVVVDYRRT